MAGSSEGVGSGGAEDGTQAIGRRPKSIGVAERGIRTTGDLCDMMSALISDTVTGAVPPEVTNATCNAAGKLIRAKELEYKYRVDGRALKQEVHVAFEGEEGARRIAAA